MARQEIHPIQTNGTAGEISPRMLGRVDVQRFDNAFQYLENFWVQPQGGLMKRSGTRFACLTEDEARKTRLIPFRYNTEQAYVLLFGHLNVRFGKDGGLLATSTAITGAANNGSGLIRITSTAHGLETGWEVTISGVVGVPAANGTWTVTKIGANTFDLQGSTFAGTYTSGGLVEGIVELATPYTEAEVPDINYTQSADVMFLVHPDHSPKKLSRLSQVSWSIEDILFTDGPYLSENVTETTLDAGASEGDGVTIIASAVTGINDDQGFLTSDVGRLIRLRTSLKDDETVRTGWITSITDNGSGLIRVKSKNHQLSTGQVVDVSGVTGPTYTVNGNWEVIVIDAELFDLASSATGGDTTTHAQTGAKFETSGLVGYGVIATRVSATEITVDIEEKIPSSSTVAWRLGAWSDTTGYPAIVAFHQERLAFARTETEPQTFWMSKSGQFDNMAPTELDNSVLDDNAVTVTLVSDEANRIEWLAPAQVLMIGTTGAEWVVKAGRSDQPITPDNILAELQTNYGGASMRPQKIADVVLFVQRSRNRLIQLFYDGISYAITPKDVSILSEHLPRKAGGIVEFAYQQDPFSILWMACADGSLLGMTFLKEQDIVSWQRHRLGGSFGEGAPVVESMACIPHPDGDSDQLWLVVKRTVNGQTRRYVEIMEKQFQPDDENDKDGAFFVDCGLTYEGSPVSSVSGLDHLEMQTVRILADGADVGTKTVVSGTVTLDEAASTIHVGLAYQPKVQTLPREYGGIFGTTQGNVKRTHEVVIRVLESLGLRVGPTFANTRPIIFRTTSDTLDSSPKLVTGDETVKVENPYDLQDTLCFTQDEPYPLTILAIMPKGVARA